MATKIDLDKLSAEELKALKDAAAAKLKEISPNSNTTFLVSQSVERHVTQILQSVKKLGKLTDAQKQRLAVHLDKLKIERIEAEAEKVEARKPRPGAGRPKKVQA